MLEYPTLPTSLQRSSRNYTLLEVPGTEQLSSSFFGEDSEYGMSCVVIAA